MAGSQDTAGKIAGDWDAYWRNQPLSSAGAPGGAHDEALRRFWSRLFDEVFSRAASVDLLDLGCGNGTVARLALTSALSRGTDVELRVSGLDHAHAALAELCRQAPPISCVAADAGQVPFKDHAFDLVTSQFGIEYAGPRAWDEAVRVLRPGGMLATALHVRDGGIYRECEINRKAVDAVRDCNLLGCFSEAFAKAPAARRSAEGHARMDAVEEKYVAAIAQTERVFRRWGRDVATGLVLRLYADVTQMYRQREAYELREVLAWVEFMTRELDNYSRRMASMLDAALSPEQFECAMTRLQSGGLNIRLRNLLGVGPQSVPIAWIVVATKAASSAS